MRQVITSMMVYNFDELSPDIQKKAVEKYLDESRKNGEDFNDDFCYETFHEIAEIFGIDLNKSKHNCNKVELYYSLSYSQGDGASFAGTYTHKPDTLAKLKETYPKDSETWAPLYKIAETLADVQLANQNKLNAHVRVKHGHYVHSHMMETTVFHDGDEDVSKQTSVDISEAMRSLADWFYDYLQEEHDYQTSFDYIKDLFAANEYEFDEDGNLT